MNERLNRFILSKQTEVEGKPHLLIGFHMTTLSLRSDFMWETSVHGFFPCNFSKSRIGKSLSGRMAAWWGNPNEGCHPRRASTLRKRQQDHQRARHRLQSLLPPAERSRCGQAQATHAALGLSSSLLTAQKNSTGWYTLTVPMISLLPDQNRVHVVLLQLMFQSLPVDLPPLLNLHHQLLLQCLYLSLSSSLKALFFSSGFSCCQWPRLCWMLQYQHRTW